MPKTKTEEVPAVAPAAGATLTQPREEALREAVAAYLEECGCAGPQDAADFVLRHLADMARHSTQFPGPVVQALMKLGS